MQRQTESKDPENVSVTYISAHFQSQITSVPNSWQGIILSTPHSLKIPRKPKISKHFFCAQSGG
ncbi:hypothetical protein GCM10011507_25380 [Edaphobacter acidisoli]|uniref:Uncharacterized protein n=1 Tax=Edaphobacter acidisoli TaxID=2040573 RepID=A0A916W7J4_9BACT|nr:hypothetical protein GCM10011507_25380 [Edaphobacter acidisoli]